MTYRRLEEMVDGWLVGDFEPACLRTDACEVACKQYEAGAYEPAHIHHKHPIEVAPDATGWAEA